MLGAMRPLLLAAALIASPAQGQEIEMIDATKLSVADLMAMAAAERDTPTPLNCCDWGGLGCAAGKPNS